MAIELQSSIELKKIMAAYFASFKNKDVKVAWCTSVGPAELLRSFGFQVYFPENHGALLGATRLANELIPVAAQCGYSNHVCSYTTADIGSYLSKNSPLKKHYGLENMPRPDVIVYNTNQCREVEDWFTFYGEQYKCPVLGIHPPRHLDDVSKDEIDLVVKQFKRIIPILEKVSGKIFNIDSFRETIKLSKEATLLWQACLKTAKAKPSPLSFFDGVIHMGPIVVLRGTTEALSYYSNLLAELTTYVNKNVGLLNKEAIRLFWDGMPIWGKLRTLSDLFIQNNTILAASTYCNSWIFEDFDEMHPFESSALAYTKIFINRSEKAKMEMLKQWVEEYHLDGIIFHDTKTCFNNSNAKFGMPLRLKEKYGIPFLIIEGDLCDLRFFSEGQSITKIETFIEQLQSTKCHAEHQN